MYFLELGLKFECTLFSCTAFWHEVKILLGYVYLLMSFETCLAYIASIFRIKIGNGS